MRGSASPGCSEGCGVHSTEQDALGSIEKASFFSFSKRELNSLDMTGDLFSSLEQSKHDSGALPEERKAEEYILTVL